MSKQEKNPNLGNSKPSPEPRNAGTRENNQGNGDKSGRSQDVAGKSRSHDDNDDRNTRMTAEPKSGSGSGRDI